MFEVGQSWTHEWSISNKIYQNFLMLSNDHNLMHTNSNYAKSKGFRDKIVHGNILSCFISFFIGELLPVKDVVIIGQNIKYENAIYINDSVKLIVILSKYHASVNFVQFEFQFVKKNDIQVASGNIQIKIL
jgi:3-hydroxybutyryl-CoA dehydratase